MQKNRKKCGFFNSLKERKSIFYTSPYNFPQYHQPRHHYDLQSDNYTYPYKNQKNISLAYIFLVQEFFQQHSKQIF